MLAVFPALDSGLDAADCLVARCTTSLFADPARPKGSRRLSSCFPTGSQRSTRPPGFDYAPQYRCKRTSSIFGLLLNLEKHPNLPIKSINDLRMRWDWSKVKAHLVPSIAGKHQGWPDVIKTGHTRLMKAVLNMDLPQNKGKGKELVLECQVRSPFRTSHIRSWILTCTFVHRVLVSVNIPHSG